MIKYLLQVRIFITGGGGGRRSFYGSDEVWNLARVNGISSKIKKMARKDWKHCSHFDHQYLVYRLSKIQ